MLLRPTPSTRTGPPAIAPAATSSGVIGRYGVIVGVCIDPVTAQVMITLRVSAMSHALEMLPGYVS